MHGLRAEALDFPIQSCKTAAIFVVELLLATEGNVVLAEAYMDICM